MGRGKRTVVEGPIGRRRGPGWSAPISATHPQVANQWVTAEKNPSLTPNDVSAGSGERVVWECERGHRWAALVKNRTLQEQGCRQCLIEGHRGPTLDHLSLDLIAKVSAAYLSDPACTLRDLWHRFKLKRGPARSVLKSEGIVIRPEPRYRLGIEERAQAIALYEAGYTLTQVANSLGISTDFLVRVLDESGVPRRSASEANRRLYLREDAFANAASDPEAAYWAGFAMADGAILENTFRIVLHHRDEDHLRKLRRFLGSEERTISHVPDKPYAYIAFSSRQLCEDLAKIGVTPRKSLVAEADPSLIDNHAFWRGVIDGDGNIRLYRKGPGQIEGMGAPTLRIETGSEKMIAQFAEYLQRNLGLSDTPEVKKSKRAWKTAVYGPTAVAALEMLYRRDGSAEGEALERKRLRAIQILHFRDLYPTGRLSKSGSRSQFQLAS